MNESAPKTVKEVDLLLKSQSLGTIGTQQPGHGHRNSKAEFGSDIIEEIGRGGMFAHLVDTFGSIATSMTPSPGPYADDLEVGHFDGCRQRVRLYANAADACADFVLAEVRWVVERRVV